MFDKIIIFFIKQKNKGIIMPKKLFSRSPK